MGITIPEMAAKLGVSPRRLNHLCTSGMPGVSGHRVILQRWKTEKGWVTSEDAIRLFRSKLNDPLYDPSEEEPCKTEDIFL